MHYPTAGWSSPVARQAHNLKVVSSNLAPATNNKGLNFLDFIRFFKPFLLLSIFAFIVLFCLVFLFKSICSVTYLLLVFESRYKRSAFFIVIFSVCFDFFRSPNFRKSLRSFRQKFKKELTFIFVLRYAKYKSKG